MGGELIPPSICPRKGTLIFSPLISGQRWENRLERDVDLLHAFPAIYQSHQLPRWKILRYGVIKELRCSAIHNGIWTPFHYQPLETVVNLALHNFKQIAGITLMNIQFTVWMLDWRDLRTVQAVDNLQQALGHILWFTGAEARMGEVQPLLTTAQDWQHAEALQQSKELTMRAFHKATDDGLVTTSFVNLRQRADEPFIKFLDKLKVILDMQRDNVTSWETSLK